jgi:hypothetical protein
LTKYLQDKFDFEIEIDDYVEIVGREFKPVRRDELLVEGLR